VSELVDVVDEHDRVVATITRAEMRRRRLRHRCVAIVVRSRAGQVLIHRRSDGKDLWPGRWDLAAGGVVHAGETYLEAAHRELGEELGIMTSELRPCGGGTYDDHDVSEITEVFEVVHDGPFRFADREIVEACFVTLDELDRRLRADPYVPDMVALVRPRL
jgi:8-oxo-dGTP pyrophosphatase MutT (NUDIX family)